MTTPTVMVSAHRGASSYMLENTIAACDLARHMGARHTSDGHLGVIHNATVDRIANGSGAVTSHTLAALRALEPGAWFGTPCAGARIPTFMA